MNTLYKNTLILIVCLVAIVILMVLVKPKPETSEEPELSNVEENIINEQTNNMYTQANSALNDRVVVSGDTISVNYTGKLVDGTVFDSNVLPEKGHVEPFVFTIGKGSVIQGWEEGFLGMKVGEKRTLTIPPEKGYGATGAGGLIPPNATLIFEVELLEIK